MKEGYFLSFLGSMVAGFITTCASLPVDIAKTRTQNMKVSHNSWFQDLFDYFNLRLLTESQNIVVCSMYLSKQVEMKVSQHFGRVGHHILPELDLKLSWLWCLWTHFYLDINGWHKYVHFCFIPVYSTNAGDAIISVTYTFVKDNIFFIFEWEYHEWIFKNVQKI